jgi:hypothetical protein
MAPHCEVELDIFSGMPNPTWVLTDAEADTLMDALGSLPRTSDRELSGDLGYRGLIVRCGHGSDEQVIRIQAGIVQITAHGSALSASDERRQLERWLHETGMPYIDADLLAMVERASN